VLKGLGFICAALLFCSAGAAAPPTSGSLVLEAKIPLGDIRGRIDHFAVDLDRQRLYVAELGNDSVGVVDLAARKTIGTIPGVRAPQGIGYSHSSDTLYVASGGDGSVRLYSGRDSSVVGRIDLGSDADNVRVDDAAKLVYVGYGSGALAVIDSATRKMAPPIRLDAHPESFQLDSGDGRIFVNVPEIASIAVVDRQRLRRHAYWSTSGLRENFPMALDERGGRLFAVFRRPPRLGVLELSTGRLIAAVATCGDADDAFFDTRRQQVYVVCGDGFVDVIPVRTGPYRVAAHIATLAGARTGLYVPSLDRLFVGARAVLGSGAAVWVLRIP
jgi:YVTN family beta-propeller protein